MPLKNEHMPYFENSRLDFSQSLIRFVDSSIARALVNHLLPMYNLYFRSWCLKHLYIMTSLFFLSMHLDLYTF